MGDEAPHRQAVIIDPNHPEAGDGGVVPPVHSRFQPGQSGNPGGWSKSFSIRHKLQADLAANPDKDGYGAKTAALAKAALESAGVGNAEGVRAVALVAEQVEGKLTEYVEQDLKDERTVILRNPPGPQPLPEGK